MKGTRAEISGRALRDTGTALQTLRERETGSAHLEEAVAAYAQGLEERTRERVPLDWTMTRRNLAQACLALFANRGDTADLSAARTACESAMDVFRHADAGHYIEENETLLPRMNAAAS